MTPRGISSVDSITRCAGPVRLPPRRLSRSCTAIGPSSVPLQRTAVIDGVARAARSLSAPAITDVAEDRQPVRHGSPRSTPASMPIPPAMIAVGGDAADNSADASWNPNSAENAAGPNDPVVVLLTRGPAAPP